MEESDLVIAELVHSIARYKEEYAALISEAQRLKTDMSMVEVKLTRSKALIQSLSSEQVRAPDDLTRQEKWCS